jgi:hypothetical protein
MDSRIEQRLYGFSPFEVLFHNRRYITRFNSTIPDFIWGNSHSRARVALSLTATSFNCYPCNWLGFKSSEHCCCWVSGCRAGDSGIGKNL